MSRAQTIGFLKKSAAETCWRRRAATEMRSTGTEPPSAGSRAQRSNKVRVNTPNLNLKETISGLKGHWNTPLCRPDSEFSHSHYADIYTREKLAAEIRLPEDTIKVPSSSFSTIRDVWWLVCWLCVLWRSGFQTDALNGGGRPSWRAAKVSVLNPTWAPGADRREGRCHLHSFDILCTHAPPAGLQEEREAPGEGCSSRQVRMDWAKPAKTSWWHIWADDLPKSSSLTALMSIPFHLGW